jgi:DNA-binding response OmpR family regulator
MTTVEEHGVNAKALESSIPASRSVARQQVTVDQLSDRTWLLASPDLVPVSVRQTPTEVHIVLAAPSAEPSWPSLGSASTRPVPVPLRPLRIDIEARTAHLDGHRLSLPRLEFDLLAHFVRYPHHVHTREQLMASVWPTGYSRPRTVDVHVARLRRRLGPVWRDTIATVFGVGYKYSPAA